MLYSAQHVEDGMGNYEKTGYLEEPFRLFHLRDRGIKEVQLHYHDFYKIIVFYCGNVTYMIEGKSYMLEPGDIIFVNLLFLYQSGAEQMAVHCSS